jgi:hypothetical protein
MGLGRHCAVGISGESTPRLPNNKTKAPFNWTATADSILEKLQRSCSQISWKTR